MQVIQQFPREVKEIENAWIPLADGCRLAARLWLPADAAARPVPAILEYLPYRKRDGTVARDEQSHPYMAGHGYACVRVDMRGNGESDGLMHDEYLPQEQDDALEVIAWLAAQPWCDGKVGMIGISWGGFNALQVAARRPPALRAIVTVCSTDDRYADDIHYKGGAMLNENLGWASTMLAYSSRPPDPALVGERWRAMWLERLENTPLLIDNWLQHQRRDDYWKHGSVNEDFAAIEAAVLAVGGWGDAYSNAVPRLLAGLAAPVRGITGPWVHRYPHIAVPEPAIGFLRECLRWWDQWLKGIDTGSMAEPLYRAYMLDSVLPQPCYAQRPGRWISEAAWPAPRIRAQTLAINATGLAAAAAPEVALRLRSPHTTGMAGGEYCAIWLGPELATDQRTDDAHSLTFDTPPLAESIEIFGAPVVELELAVDRHQAQIAVRLCDVWPEGNSARVTYGVLNLSHRDSHQQPAPLEPGKRYRVRLQLDDIAYAVPPGHRLRLAVSTAYWPLIWPAPEPATLTLFAGPGTLSLPVRPPQTDQVRFTAPEAAPPARIETMRAASNQRTVTRDVASGETVLSIIDDFGAQRFTTHGLTTASIGRERWRIRPDDPLSARGETHWTESMGRGEWQVRTETFTTLRADREQFHITARLEAYAGDDLVFERDWDRSVPRDNL